MKRSLLLRLFIGILILWIMLLFYPVRTTYYRAGLIGCPALLLAAVTILLWKRRVLRWVPGALVGSVGLILVLPGRAADPAALRSAYVARLGRFDKTRYVWGGETCLGVDCSGLLRVSLVDAHLSEAIRTINPRLARQAISLWWNDGSARDFSEGYGGRTVRVGETAALHDMPIETLCPGDFAVTADGSHVFAYLGAGQWIQADPMSNHVMRLDQHAASTWHDTKVMPCRWLCLAL